MVESLALVETSRVDSKGRVLIPQHMRQIAGILPNDKIILSLGKDANEITLRPAHEKKLLRLVIEISDRPGALAAAAAALAELKVDLVSSYSHSSKRGEVANWVVQCNPGNQSIQKIKARLAAAKARLLSASWD
ncbi:MAG: ACT domain-containing protein [Candidatus Micrarchaeota archaeon]|nr:ACT domain-containing protein [Candidatus Micrarchaeota archaeon]